jgi:membrane-bound metal-dependent hydrolase YbcI (DUF457 family)
VLLIHALAPRYVSFLAFCAANVLIDIEPLYYLLTRQYPLHRFFHTYVGASVVAVGAIAGTLSHVLLDSVMHPDVRPFAPFNDSNPLLGALPVHALHWSCVAFGFVGLVVLGVRSFRREPS